MIKSMTIIHHDPDHMPDRLYFNLCNYRGVKRYVHASACTWHIKKNDPECRRLKCPVFLKGRDLYDAGEIQETLC